jgi:hypothetical protein
MQDHPKGESDGDGGSIAFVGVDSGACVGEESEVLSGAAAGARVSISTFIPWLQCPIVPQMKGMVVGLNCVTRLGNLKHC